MDPSGFCRQTRLVIVAGKGGVGKTTVCAALARMASRLGLSALIVEVEGKSGLAAAFGAGDGLDYEEQVLVAGSRAAGSPTGEIRARTLTPDRALIEYLEDHGLGFMSRRLARSGVVEVVATGVPGIKDILILGKVKQLEQAGTADLIILDTPAAGHAVSFLMSARGLLDAVTVGPIRSQAADVLELLTDAARCRVLLVTLAEETPVNEAIETADKLEEKVGVDLGPVVVNGLYPAIAGLDADPAEVAAETGAELPDDAATSLRAAAQFRSQRQSLQDEQLARLGDSLPLPQLRLPALLGTDIGPQQLDLLADALLTEVTALKGQP